MAISNMELGSVYGFGDLELVLFGSTLVGFEGVEWKKVQKKDLIHGVGRESRGVGRGNIECSGSIDILWDELVKIIDFAPNGDITSIPPFSMTVWFASTTLSPKRRVTLNNVEFTESPFKTTQGETSIKCSLPILVGNILHSK